MIFFSLRFSSKLQKCSFMSEITFLEQFMFEAKYTCLKTLDVGLRQPTTSDSPARNCTRYHASHSSPWAVVLRNISGLEWLTAVKIRYKLIFYCRVSLSRLSRTRGYIYHRNLRLCSTVILPEGQFSPNVAPR